MTPFGQVTEENFDLHFNVNVKGLFFTVQKALPLMKDGGSIILNASIASSKGMQAMSVYSATKAAVRSFARTWTVDQGTQNSRQRRQPRPYCYAHFRQNGPYRRTTAAVWRSNCGTNADGPHRESG